MQETTVRTNLNPQSVCSRCFWLLEKSLLFAGGNAWVLSIPSYLHLAEARLSHGARLPGHRVASCILDLLPFSNLRARRIKDGHLPWCVWELWHFFDSQRPANARQPRRDPAGSWSSARNASNGCSSTAVSGLAGIGVATAAVVRQLWRCVMASYKQTRGSLLIR